MSTTDRKLLRLAATLLFVGLLLFFLAGIFHPSREIPNNHRAVFAEYANSADWAAVHLGQPQMPVEGAVHIVGIDRPAGPRAEEIARGLLE